jgi:hypothetical protein
LLYRRDLNEFFPVDIIKEQEVKNWKKTDEFENENIAIKADHIKYRQQQGTREQLHIADNANDLEIISIQMMIDQFNRLGKMIAVGYHDFRIILGNRDHYRPAIG